MVELNGRSLGLSEVEEIVFKGAQVEAAADALDRVQASADLVREIINAEQPVYGINTGFGKLSRVQISRSDLERLQINIIRSHAAGVGEPLPDEISRAALLFRINSLLCGYSGVRVQLIEYLIQFLNAGVAPVIPSQGSVGSSGDLAPLSHMALLLVGEGEAYFKNERISGSQMLESLKLDPLTLHPKEGLAFINGTQVTLAVGWYVLHSAIRLIKTAIGTAALSLEAAQGKISPFDARISEVHPHKGQIEVASQIRELLRESRLVDRAKDIQDPYSLRCIPQVLGSCWDSFEAVKQVFEIEMNSTTDNPLLFPETKEAISGGNFHGEVLGMALEQMALALAEMGSFSERRCALLLETPDLPAFLVPESGLNSGYMIAQYTAASLCTENKVLAHPAVTDSIPTSAGKEDFNSSASISARKVYSILQNVEYIIAIEILIAAQALGFRGRAEMGIKTGEIYDRVRSQIEHLTEDRPIYQDVTKVREMIGNDAFIWD